MASSFLRKWTIEFVQQAADRVVKSEADKILKREMEKMYGDETESHLDRCADRFWVDVAIKMLMATENNWLKMKLKEMEMKQRLILLQGLQGHRNNLALLGDKFGFMNVSVEDLRRNYVASMDNVYAPVLNYHSSQAAVKFSEILAKIYRGSGEEIDKVPKFSKKDYAGMPPTYPPVRKSVAVGVVIKDMETMDPTGAKDTNAAVKNEAK